MRELLDDATHEDMVSIGHILQAFGVRGFAFLILMLSLLNIVIFMLPLISILFGLPMIILAVQMILGFHAPIFPSVIRHRTIPRAALLKGLEKSIYWIEKAENYVRPRFLFLSMPQLGRVHGVLALVLAIMVTLPVPLFNLPPSFGLVMLAIGIMQRDGIFVVLAYAIGTWCLVLFESLRHVFFSLT